jgi:hypothetical protein
MLFLFKLGYIQIKPEREPARVHGVSN